MSETTSTETIPDEEVVQTELSPRLAGDPEPDSDLIPGTKLKFSDAKRLGVPDKIIQILPHVSQQVAPRRLGIVEANGDWYVYRSISRREFKHLVAESTDRAMKRVQAATQGGAEVNPATLQAETQAFVEEKISASCCLFPQLDLGKMGDYDAGIPKLIHDAVMARSNFEQTSEPITL